MVKSIVYCPECNDYELYINDRFVGAAPTLGEAADRLAEIAYSLVTHPLAGG